MEENRARQRLYDSLMNVPHRQYSALVPTILSALEADPDFIIRAALHMVQGGTAIRDQVDCAVIALLLSPPEFEVREIGRLALLGNGVYRSEPGGYRGLEPYRIFRIEQFLACPFVVACGDQDMGRYPSLGAAEKARSDLERRLQEDIAELKAGRPARHYDRSVLTSRGNLNQIAAQLEGHLGAIKIYRDNMSRAGRVIRRAMHDYMAMLERDPGRFDQVVLLNRKAVNRVYRRYRIKAGDRAHDIIFKNRPPEDSVLHVVKQIAAEPDQRERLRMVVENKIPPTVATSLLGAMTPEVAITLLSVMSPTQALNSRAQFERLGILKIPEVKRAFLGLVSRASRSVASATHRVSAQGQDAEVQAAVEAAKQRAFAQAARIERATLLLVDISRSMHRSIEIAQRLAAMVVPIMDGPFMCIAFNENAREVNLDGVNTHSEVSRRFRLLRAGGSTSPEAGLSHAVARRGFIPEQVVVVTDGGENRGTYEHGLRVMRDRGVDVPHTIVIRVDGDPDRMCSNMRRAGFDFDRFEWGGDYNLLDQVLTLLGGPHKLTLVEQILETPIPRVLGLTE